MWSAVRAGPAIVKEKQVKMREEGKMKKRETAEAVSVFFLSVSGLQMRFVPRFYLLAVFASCLLPLCFLSLFSLCFVMRIGY